MRNRPRRTLAEARTRHQRAGQNRVVYRMTYGNRDLNPLHVATIRKALRWTIAQGGAGRPSTAATMVRRRDHHRHVLESRRIDALLQAQQAAWERIIQLGDPLADLLDPLEDQTTAPAAPAPEHDRTKDTPA